MRVGGVDDDYINPGIDDRLSAFLAVGSRAYCGPDPQAALVVFAGIGEFNGFFNVFNRDEAGQVVVLVNNQQFFNPVLVQDFFCLLKRGAGLDGDEIFPWS